MSTQLSSRPARRRRIAGFALSMGALLVLSACSGTANDPNASNNAGESGDSAETQTIRVVTSVSNSFPYVVLEAAEQLGTWKGSGINVELVAGTTPTTGQIMAANQADIVIDSGISIASNISSGLEATMIAGNDLYWDTRIIGRADSGIDSVEDLKGKNFGITGKGGPGDYTIRKMAEKLGWSDSDYKETTLKDLPALTAALSTGAIDAFPWGSDVGYKMQAAGTGVILSDTADFVGPSVFHGFAVNDSFLKANPQLVKKFFETYFAKVKEVQSNPDLLTDILVNNWEVPAEAAELMIDNSTSKISTDGEIASEELKGLAAAVAFNTGDESLKDEPIKYTYWGEIK